MDDLFNIFDIVEENKSSIDIMEIIKKEQLEIPSLIIDKLLKERIRTEKEFYQKLDFMLRQYESNILFPHHLVAFYPQVREHTCTKDIVCHISGCPIKKGEHYYTYHPLIQDLNTNKVYTISKEIKASLGYIDLFPTTLSQYEDWYYKIQNAYYQDSDIIDFYLLSVECGDNALELIELKKGTKEHKMKLLKRKIKKLQLLELKLIKKKEKYINQEQVMIEMDKTKRKIQKLNNKLSELYNS